MQFFWLTKSIPELADLSNHERRQIWSATRWKVLRHWQPWVIGPAIGLPVGFSLTGIQSTSLRLLAALLAVGLLGLLLRPLEVYLRRQHLGD